MFFCNCMCSSSFVAFVCLLFCLSKKPVAAWQYVNAVLVVSVWALPVAYKHSFGG